MVKSSDYKRIQLVRHAPVTLQTPFLGRTDVEADGAVTQRLAEQLHANYDLIVSSPLQRCRALAQSVHQRQPQADFCLDANWQERDWGLWDGCTLDQLEADVLAEYYAAPFDYPITNAETFQQMRARLHQAWLRLVAHPARSILCVTHGGPMRMVLQSVFHLNNAALFQWQIDYGCQLDFAVYDSADPPFVRLMALTPLLTPSEQGE